MFDPNSPVARVVLDHAETAPVFQRHRIDFCCHGNVSVTQACATRGLDVASFLSELELAIAECPEASPPDPRQLSTPELIEQIVVRHHGYLREALPYVCALATTVARVHGGEDDRLCAVDAIVSRLNLELTAHLDLEESILFPELLAARKRGKSVATELDQMVAEHHEIGAKLSHLRALTDDYQPPKWACSTYRALLAELGELEADLYSHVHLENYVLMPRFSAS